MPTDGTRSIALLHQCCTDKFVAKRLTQNSLRSTASPIAGSIGEHLAVAHLLETFAWDEHFKEIFSNIEVFHIDRGTDIGIDFVVRLHVKKVSGLKNFSFLIGIQVKNYGKKSQLKPLPPAKLRFIESFPGPVLLLLYKDRAKSVSIENWLDFNKRSADKKLDPPRIEIGPDKGYMGPLRDRVIEECMSYVLSELSPEKDLSTYDLTTAMSTAKLLNRLKPNDDKIWLLMNRVMIRSARWNPSEYKKAKCCVDLQMSKIARKRRPCPSYDGYCIHYQAALVRDEGLRSGKWLGREYASIRMELVTAFKALFPDRVCHDHDEQTKARLYRCGLGVVALIIMLDLAQGSSTHLGEWKKWASDLQKMMGTELEKSVSKEDRLSLALGSTYRSFVDLATCAMISRERVAQWLEESLKRLDKRPRNRDSDEDAVVHFLGAGLWMKAGDMKAASTQVDLATAIARVQKKSLWIHPIDYVRARIEHLRKTAERRDA